MPVPKSAPFLPLSVCLSVLSISLSVSIYLPFSLISCLCYYDLVGCSLRAKTR